MCSNIFRYFPGSRKIFKIFPDRAGIQYVGQMASLAIQYRQEFLSFVHGIVSCIVSMRLLNGHFMTLASMSNSTTYLPTYPPNPSYTLRLISINIKLCFIAITVAEIISIFIDSTVLTPTNVHFKCAIHKAHYFDI